MSNRPSPCTVIAGGVRLRVHVTPKASADRVSEVVTDGRASWLRLRIAAPPRDGEANAAVIALLARTLHLPKSALSVVAGASSREKTIVIRGDAAAIAASIDAYLAVLQGERR